MKRFILKCALLAAIVIVSLYSASAVYVHSNAFRVLESAEQEWTDSYHDMPEQINVAVFGSSHAHLGFRSAPEGKSFFNFALSAQTPLYDYMQMRQFAGHIVPGALVVLTVSYPSPYWPEHERNFERLQNRYYRILSPENIIEYDPLVDFLHHHFALIAEDLTTVFKSIFRPTAITSSQDVTKKLDPDTLPQQADRIISNHWYEYIAPVFPETNPTMMDAYRQMLTMCQENGWQAVLVTPPYLKEYNDCFPEDFFPVFYNEVDDLCQQFDVPYLDYSHDETYYGCYELYRDIDHLDLDGAALFDRQFFADVQQMGIWDSAAS